MMALTAEMGYLAFLKNGKPRRKNTGRTVIFIVSLNAWKHEETWPMFHLFSGNMNIGHVSVSFSYDGKISFRPVESSDQSSI